MREAMWKYLGAMFMEVKDGQQAVSFTRVLALVMFGMLMWKWGMSGEGDLVPNSMLYTFWSLVGLKGVESVAKVIKGQP